MRIAIIRSCDRDDYSAHVCYLSMKKHSVADKYIFFHEHGLTVSFGGVMFLWWLMCEDHIVTFLILFMGLVAAGATLLNQNRNNGK